MPPSSNNPKPDSELGKTKFHAIKLKVLFYIAWRNLASKKLRSALTISGVVIGIMAIFFLLTFGLGIQQLVTSEIIGDSSLKAIEVITPNSKLLKLNEEFVNEFRTYSEVEKVGTQFSYPGAISFEGGEADTVIYGINTEYQDLVNLNLVAGRTLKEGDNKTIIINKSVLDALGIAEPKEAIDKELTIVIPLNDSDLDVKEINESFKVVGVIDSGAGSEIFMHDHPFFAAGVKNFQQVRLLVREVDQIDPVRKQVEAKGFQTNSLIDTLDEMNRIFKFFNLALISFGSIGMVVSVLGMFNTLTISLLERTKEIGLMIALGGRRRDMSKLFIMEAVVISFVGSIIGVILAMAAGEGVNLAMNGFARRRGVAESFDLFSSPFWAILAITGFTVMVGFAVAILPAKRAEHVDPIDALRRE